MAHSAAYEFSHGGSLYDLIGAKEYSHESVDEEAQKSFHRRKLELAWQTISAAVALHDVDHDGRPSVAHDDLDVTQFVTVDRGQTFKLSD